MKSVKQLLAFVLFMACIAAPLCTQAEDQERILHGKGLLWKIEKSGLAASYIYGTMHVGDPRVLNLAPAVTDAFNNAQCFAMEMLLNFEAMGAMAQASFFNDGSTLKSVMQPNDYQKLIMVLQENYHMPEAAVINMRPWAVMVMMMMPTDGQANKDSALDMVLYRQAAMGKKQLLGLETVQEQLAIFNSMSLDEQIWMLNRSVEDNQKVVGQMDALLEAYLERDLAALVKLQEQNMYEDSDIDDRLLYEMLDKRNPRMVERMQSCLQKGNAFVAIGALHLPGEQGVLHLLEQQGYTVAAVY
ncbi:MAG TPA: TraB/GumN family protein [Gammaproteobacteria bacterium]